MRSAVIVSTARTPIGRAYRGAFNDTAAQALGGHAIAQAVGRAGLEPAEVEDVIMGCANPEGATGWNIARQIALAAGCPVSVSGMTVNRFCSSGLQTIAMAAQRVVAGEADILVAPDLVSGNMLAKQLIHLAGADAAGLVLGARVPIILTSRSDSREARLASCALAQLFAHRTGTPP